MTTQEPQKRERVRYKSKKRAEIVATATTLFATHGIAATTMQEIADAAEIGIATLFRYFPKKDDLVITVAVERLAEVPPIFQKANEAGQTAFEKTKILFDLYAGPLLEHEDQGLKLLEDFDTYAVYSQLSKADMAAFNEVNDQISKYFNEIVESAKQDDSIRKDINADVALTTAIHSFTVFVRKLSVTRVLNRYPINDAEQIQMMKNLLLDYLQNKD